MALTCSMYCSETVQHDQFNGCRMGEGVNGSMIDWRRLIDWLFASEYFSYGGIDIATYIEITTIMECQISRDIHSYNSTNCLSCPLNIVNCSYRSRSSADLDHSSHL